MELKSIQELLEAGGLRHPSDLDLLLFFYRHPHVLLTLDHLAAYTGYDLQQVAQPLDFPVGGGLLRRELHETHSREMYLVGTGGAEEWLQSLLGVEVPSTATPSSEPSYPRSSSRIRSCG
ncbi:MAG: hypothetical protein HY217_02735 [Candidatus Rokubacteria bacterium]|nr:hypothetical protein [Candidatus Rokubacteria bacterium]